MTTEDPGEPAIKESWQQYLKRKFITSIRVLLGTAALMIVGQVGLIWFSNTNPLFELANHFAMHGLVAGLVLLVVMLLFHKRWDTMLLAGALIYLAFLVQPWNLYLRSEAPTLEHQSDRLKILSWNVLSTNRSYDAIQQIVAREDPDVIVFVETRPNLFKKLPEVEQKYPFTLQYLDWGGSGLTIFSRVKDTTFHFEGFGFDIQPAIVATIDDRDSGKLLKLVGFHPLSPIPVSRTKIRDSQISLFVEWAQSEVAPLCVCGDFNTTPWTRAFQSLIDSGFRDSRVASGNCPSWPSDLGVWGIPIDHALCRGDCTIRNRRVIYDAPGSDHFPIVFELWY